MAKQLGEIAKKTQGLSDYAGTAVNTGIVAVTAGIEQLTTLAAYRCPCVSLAKLGNCTPVNIAGNPSCSQLLNYGYGMSFIIAPAIGLLVFGMASNPKLWKSVTGIIKKTKSERREANEICWTIGGVIGQALYAPITWVAIALLDGRYYACATTSLPYDVERPSASYKSCEAVAISKIVYTSSAFNDNRSFSQLLGWIIIAVFLIVGMFVYCLSQCTFPLTYYHAKYYLLYRTAEEAEFTDEMQKKAQHDAEANVLKFMEKRRDKALWDRISTVYDFHRDEKSLALYSNLHEWVLENAESEEMIPLTGGGEEGHPEEGGLNEDEETATHATVSV
ncbi:calcium homeostasis modulator protein 6-like [Ciona intestinalis]